MTIVFYAIFLLLMRRALADHAKLPWARYRDSNIFLRIQVGVRGGGAGRAVAPPPPPSARAGLE